MRLVKTSLLFFMVVIFNICKGQDDFYLQPILKSANQVPTQLPGEFIKGFGVGKGDVYYTFSNEVFPVTYYKPLNGCGYFRLYDKNYTVENRFAIKNFGCEMDEITFKVYNITVGQNKYFFISSIAESNGRGTRDVFFELFDVTDGSNILFYPMWSLYGSQHYFGDYNGDGVLDFLEVRYDRTKRRDNDTFKITLQTLNAARSEFITVHDKFIVIHQDFIDNAFHLVTLENHW